MCGRVIHSSGSLRYATVEGLDAGDVRRWAMRKFKRFATRKVAAALFLKKLAKTRAHLFEHWRIGMSGTFA